MPPYSPAMANLDGSDRSDAGDANANAIAPVAVDARPAYSASAPSASPAPPPATYSVAARNAGAPLRPRVETVGDLVPVYGDAAGEHLRLDRGRFDAWIHVGIAFLVQIIAVGGIVGGVASALVHAITDSREAADLTLFLAGAAAGIPAAFFSFRDRWRCIEAVSSRFCSGMMNLSLIYVPAVALVYANVRGIQKLRGR